MRVLRITEVQLARTSISASCEIEDLRFHATVWYDDIDLHDLARQHGEDLLERIALHVALFQLNAVVSLRPDIIALGPYARFRPPELAGLWRAVVQRGWAQWRWEHDLQQHIPELAGPATA